jgi:urease accessory protein
MQYKHYLEGTVFILSLLAVPVAQAHNVAYEGAALLAGFSHPLLGWDHLLAMLAVGLWAAQQRGRFVWRLPVVFPAMMIVGASVAGAGVVLPELETGIASSLLVLGLLLAFAVHLPFVFSVVLVGLFALFHGFAHGAEMPQTVSAVTYGLGFILATTVLQVLGVRLGLLARGALTATLLRMGGGAIAVAGVLTWA